MQAALNSADTIFMMVCTAMVLVMTPALAFFYGGLVRSRSTLFIMMESFIAVGVVTLIWVFGGFGLAFGSDIGGLIGNITDYFGLVAAGNLTQAMQNAGIPLALFFLYQLMFCIITVPLMSGAFAERLTMRGYVILVVVFTLVVYIPVCHWVWGSGWLAKLGFVDFSGGAVIHTSAGFGALAAVLALGNRKLARPGMQPNNLMAAAVGTGLLWFGWFGFNMGSALGVGELAVVAFENTAVGLAFGMISYCVVARVLNGRVTFVDVLTGSVAGLATITPASGYVEPSSAMIIGIVAGIVCNAFLKLTDTFGWDDALGVWGVHGMGGFTGCLLIGVLAASSVNGVSASLAQFGIQLVGVVVIAVLAFVVTYATARVLKACGMEPTEDQIARGLDEALLHESAYRGRLAADDVPARLSTQAGRS